MTEYNDYHEEVDIREAEKRYAKRCFQPTYDMTFKLMFGEQGHTRALIHLLNCLHVSKDPITKVVIQNSELPADGVELKCFRLDITAETDKNDVAQIEMQCDRLLDDKVVITKSLEYWARLFSRGLERGQSYGKAKRTVSITITDFVLFDDDDDFWSCSHIRNDKNNKMITDLFEMQFFELPKVKEVVEEDLLTCWAEFLKRPDSEATKLICEKIPEIKEAHDMFKRVTEDPKKRDLILRREWARQDYLAHLNDKYEEGIEKGKAEGKEETRIQNARNMLRDGMPVDLVSKYSGLTTERVKTLMI